MVGDVYYLSSLDSVRFEPVRECRFVRLLTFDTGKEAVEAQISPGVIGQEFNRSDFDTVILTPRHAGVTINPVSEFPCFVHIAITRIVDLRIQSPIRADDLYNIAWGDLYRTRGDAERHAFG